MVTWKEAMREVARLGLTLPTEAQWEYACRAGSQTTYATGSEPGSLRGFANIADEGSRPQWPGADLEPGFADGWTGHAPVGTYEANPFGLHDMNGNVGEWCRDGFETYRDHPPAPGDGLRGREDQAYRVVRGGSFYDLASKSRAAFRGAWSPDQKEYDSGLRPARPVER
jgi:formylglycine-generating enzyme required for sulfatase activity